MFVGMFVYERGLRQLAESLPVYWDNDFQPWVERRITELEGRIRNLSTRVYDLECEREKSEEREMTEHDKAASDLAFATKKFFEAAEAGNSLWLEKAAFRYRNALKAYRKLKGQAE